MMHLDKNKEWFATWFDSPYYHQLYDNRDEQEAAHFLSKLVSFLQLPQGTKVLDLACGAGRHSRVLSKCGLTVHGCDLSVNSIREAINNSAPELHFFVHDMRNPLPEPYQVVFNLFTSFGYFDDIQDNLKVLQSVFQALEPQGMLILDFMNSEKIVADLKRRQEIRKGAITFHVQKTVVNGRIVKTIAFEDQGTSYFFQEKVQTLYLEQFEELFHQVGFQITHLFGDYDLNPFHTSESDRLIFVCTKP